MNKFGRSGEQTLVVIPYKVRFSIHTNMRTGNEITETLRKGQTFANPPGL